MRLQVCAIYHQAAQVETSMQRVLMYCGALPSHWYVQSPALLLRSKQSKICVRKANHSNVARLRTKQDRKAHTLCNGHFALEAACELRCKAAMPGPADSMITRDYNGLVAHRIKQRYIALCLPAFPTSRWLAMTLYDWGDAPLLGKGVSYFGC